MAGLFYGNPRQLLAQFVGIGANLVYVGAASVVLFKVLDKVIGMRVAPEVELQGLDFHEVSAPAYPGEGQLIGSSVLVFEAHRPRHATVALPTPVAQEAQS